MTTNNNILLITDYENSAKIILEKLILLRGSDSITVCSTKNYKKTLTNSVYSIVILHETDSEDFTIKLLNNIKETKIDTEILLLLNDTNPQFVLRAYDCGIFDYFTLNSDEYEILIKTVNCFKIRTYKEINSRNEKFLYQQGVIDSKTNLYQYKYLKEVFLDFSENLKIQNGAFVVLTLDESTKTKISTNRLASVIKNSIRLDDIAAVGKSGKFYIIIPNISLENVKNLIDKIQNKMGENFKIRAGVSKIGINSFDTLDKISNDGLISAIKNDLTMVCLENNSKNNEPWLCDDEEIPKKKDFKLFRTIVTNKLENTITPLFYRYKKEFENKLTNTQICQYANDIESVFSLKNDILHSELTIRYNGHAKYNIEITHSGLDSAENSKIEIPLKDLTDKLLINLLKKLKDEYKETAYTKGTDNA